MFAWIVSHQAVVSGSVVAILDLVFALIPNLAANGILHQVYLWVKAIGGGGVPPAVTPIPAP